jgi:hypothetical protein
VTAIRAGTESNPYIIGLMCSTRQNLRGIMEHPPVARVATLSTPGRRQIQGHFKLEKIELDSAKGKKRDEYMPTSKKQMVKLNQAKKVKAEELSKQAAAGSEQAKKKLKKLEKKRK